MPKFTFITPGWGDQFCELQDGKFTVGRGAANSLIILDPFISREHSELLIYGTELIVRDRGSKNGTFVNDRPVQGQSGVNHGQVLRFGCIEIRVAIERAFAKTSPDTVLVEFRDYLKTLRTPPPSPRPLPITFAALLPPHSSI